MVHPPSSILVHPDNEPVLAHLIRAGNLGDIFPSATEGGFPRSLPNMVLMMVISPDGSYGSAKYLYLDVPVKRYFM